MAASNSNQDSDYELLPHKEIIELKRQMEEMKAGPSAKQLMSSMEELRKQVSDLMELFKAATQELKTEEKDELSLGKKVDKVINQNKVIAEAMVSLSDRLDRLDGNKGQEPSPAHDTAARATKRQGPPQQERPAFSEYESSRETFASPQQGAPSFTPKGKPEAEQQPQGSPNHPEPDNPFGQPSPGFEPPEFSAPQFDQPPQPWEPQQTQGQQQPWQQPPQPAPWDTQQPPWPPRGQEQAGFGAPPFPSQGPQQGPSRPPEGRQPGTPPPADFSDLPAFGDEEDQGKTKKKGLFGAFKR